MLLFLGMAAFGAVGGWWLFSSRSTATPTLNTNNNYSSSQSNTPQYETGPAEILPLDSNITPGQWDSVRYQITDVDGIDESDLIAQIVQDIETTTELSSIFSNGADIETTRDSIDFVDGTVDTYKEISVKISGVTSNNLNTGSFSGPSFQFSDSRGNYETVNLPLSISEPATVLQPPSHNETDSIFDYNAILGMGLENSFDYVYYASYDIEPGAVVITDYYYDLLYVITATHVVGDVDVWETADAINYWMYNDYGMYFEWDSPILTVTGEFIDIFGERYLMSVSVGEHYATPFYADSIYTPIYYENGFSEFWDIGVVGNLYI